MKLFGLIFVIYSINAQSPFANTLDVSNAIRQFTNTFLIDLEQSSPSNFVFSPYSIHSIFSQLLFGAQGDTKTQLQVLLSLTPTDRTINQYRSLSSNLNSGSAQLLIANELALAQGFKPKPSYIQTLGNNYKIAEYDFANDRANSVKKINDNVSQNTRGLIKDLLLEQDVDELTQMILINAIYFKAQWKTAFNPEDTFDGVFNSPVAGNVNTSFMTMDAKVRLVEEEDFTIVELPYADETMSMIIVLPKPGASNTISEKLQSFNISKLKQATPIDVSITIPKFSMTYQTYLKEKMENLGATDLFGSRANLRGISDAPLYVSNGVHQVNIQVNEEGSEAAAATAVVVGVRTLTRKKRFFADRPFLFMIQDFQNNITLFAGKVVDPSNLINIQKPPTEGFEEVNSKITDQFKNNQPLSTSSNSVASQPKPAVDPQVCGRLLRDFPNALDNHKICNKVKEAGQFLDWLRENRNLCEQSSDHYNQFMQNNCSGIYCNSAQVEVEQWRRDYSAQCSDIDRDNQQDCKNLENKLKAFKTLQC